MPARSSLDESITQLARGVQVARGEAAARVLRQALRVRWVLLWAHSAPQEVQGLPQGVPVLRPAGLF